MFIAVFIITILILVVIHELGHFLAAKRFNIKVLEFGFGLPPRALGKKIGETIYSLNWLPFGGFVRLLGEDETDSKVLENERSSAEWRKHSFAHQAVSKRILVVVAGVMMNLVLAWVLFWIVLGAQNFQTQLPLLAPFKFRGVQQINERVIFISDVTKNTPADLAGLKAGERILAVESQLVDDPSKLVDKVKSQAGQEIKLTVSDLPKKEVRDIYLTPRVNPPAGQGALGVALGSFEIASLSYQQPWQKVLSGPMHALNLTTYSWEILTKTVARSWQKQDFTPVSQSVAGPVGITAIVKEILSVPNPLLPYLEFMAALSLNLALVNILPFPGLDGGRLLFLAIEASTRKRVHHAIEKYIHSVGLAILLTLIILITLSDIRKLIF